jgi:RNA polymerase sigma-70 factor, ECF subfamily
VASSGTPGDLDPFARDLIARKARQLVRRAGFRAHDLEDIQQELAAFVVERQDQHDATRAPVEAFTAMLVRYAVTTLLRHRRAAKRTPPSHPTPAPPVDAVPAPVGSRDERRHNLVLDTAAVLDGLPPDQRELAEHLKGGSFSDASRALGVPRTTLYGRVRSLRAAFERAGLRDYL